MNISIQLRSYIWAAVHLNQKLDLLIPGKDCPKREIFGFLKPNLEGGHTLLLIWRILSDIYETHKSTKNQKKGHNFETNPDIKNSSGTYRKHRNKPQML